MAQDIQRIEADGRPKRLRLKGNMGDVQSAVQAEVCYRYWGSETNWGGLLIREAVRFEYPTDNGSAISQDGFIDLDPSKYRLDEGTYVLIYAHVSAEAGHQPLDLATFAPRDKYAFLVGDSTDPGYAEMRGGVEPLTVTIEAAPDA